MIAGPRARRRAQRYLAALKSAGHYRTAARELLPQFAHPDKNTDYDLIYAVTPMSQVLTYLGRAEEADALFKTAQSVWPLGSHANALNITANHANFLLGQD